MSEEMTTADRAAVSVRIVETPAAGALATAEGVSHEDIVALKLAALTKSGDLGGVRRLVNDLQHGRGPWHVAPWPLILAMSSLAIRQLHS